MNNRISQIALRIALIKEESSESEILQAVRLLEEYGTSSALLEYLAGRVISSSNENDKVSRTKNKPIDEQQSRAVIELNGKDPDKYELLSEFDTLIRKGTVLPEVDDIKRLGRKISKDFVAKKSRREAISALMTVMAELPLNEIKDIFSSSLSAANSDDKENEYQKLARFLIKGKN